MNDIYISINNREQVIKLPVLPQNFKIGFSNKNETYETLNYDVKLIGNKGLMSVTIESFFPNNEYTFNRDNSYRGYEYVNILESWISRKIPMRLTVTGSNINIPVVIDSFTYGEQDSTGDVYYSITFSEYKLFS